MKDLLSPKYQGPVTLVLLRGFQVACLGPYRYLQFGDQVCRVLQIAQQKFVLHKVTLSSHHVILTLPQASWVLDLKQILLLLIFSCSTVGVPRTVLHPNVLCIHPKRDPAFQGSRVGSSDSHFPSTLGAESQEERKSWVSDLRLILQHGQKPQASFSSCL